GFSICRRRAKCRRSSGTVDRLTWRSPSRTFALHRARPSWSKTPPLRCRSELGGVRPRPKTARLEDGALSGRRVSAEPVEEVRALLDVAWERLCAESEILGGDVVDAEEGEA